jgi:hypothetical protein
VPSRLQRSRLPAGGGLLLVPAAALIVHQLRYALAYGSQAGLQLSAQGHSYEHSLVPWVVLALGVGLSAFLGRAAHAVRTGETGGLARLSASVIWLITTAGLIGIYALQESLEELYASGHPTGVGGILGHGGWWAVPAAAGVAAGVVALLRLGRAVLRLAGGLGRYPRRPRPFEVFRHRVVVLVTPAPLARAAAGRAPPSRLPAA